MKSRLVWKIWGMFFLALVLLIGVPVLVGMLRTPVEKEEHRRLEGLNAAAAIYRYGGRAAMQDATATWPAKDRATLEAHLGRTDMPSVLPPLPDNSPTRLWPIAVQILAGLLVSAALAIYLVRPLMLMRDGFRRIARGELDVRLAAGLGDRRDEIADLARDFDRMATRLQQVLESRDRLLHDVSHELRSPLSRLSVAVELAKLNGKLTEQDHARIETECLRLNALVGDILSLFRAESQGSVDVMFFDLAELLRVVCEDARYEALPRGVEVRLEISEGLSNSETPPILHGPTELLRRAVENVIRNAVRFSPANEAVDIGARIDNEIIYIEVRDRGPGVSGDTFDTLVAPFMRGASDEGGAGLGLSIARRGLAAFGGDLDGDNHPDGGLCVRIWLPVNHSAGRDRG